MEKIRPRKKYLSNEPLQMKYLILLVVSMLVPVIFVGGCLYFLIFNIMAEQVAIPEYVAQNLVPVINKINMILLAGFPPLVLLLLLWGVILSHRFAGPMERLRNEIEAISRSGDYSKRLKVRKNDEIRPLADVINRLLDKVSGAKR
jgi:methyl-accepting chemotaxis protein